MIKKASVLFLVGLLAACGPAEDDDDDDNKIPQRIKVNVSGYVALHPEEAKWREANEMATPDLTGASIDVEDALRAAFGPASLGDTTIDENGRWELEEVDVTNVSLAIVATVRLEGTLMQSGFGLYLGRPSEDVLDKPVYVLTNEFVQALATATGSDFEELVADGFIFGQIAWRESETTEERTPIEGAKLARAVEPEPEVVDNSGDARIYYPAVDFSGSPSDSTTANGLFILTKAGSAKDYTAVAAGKSFESRLSGSRTGTAVSVFIHEVE